MGFLLVALQALANPLHETCIEQRREREVLIKTFLPAKRSGGNGLWPQFRQTQFLEWDMRQIQGLRAAVVGLAVDAILVVAAGTILDALLGIEQQHGARPENYGARRADAGATWLQPLVQPMAAQFALRDRKST